MGIRKKRVDMAFTTDIGSVILVEIKNKRVTGSAVFDQIYEYMDLAEKYMTCDGEPVNALGVIIAPSFSKSALEVLFDNQNKLRGITV